MLYTDKICIWCYFVIFFEYFDTLLSIYIFVCDCLLFFKSMKVFFIVSHHKNIFEPIKMSPKYHTKKPN